MRAGLSHTMDFSLQLFSTHEKKVPHTSGSVSNLSTKAKLEGNYAHCFSTEGAVHFLNFNGNLPPKQPTPPNLFVALKGRQDQENTAGGHPNLGSVAYKADRAFLAYHFRKGDNYRLEKPSFSTFCPHIDVLVTSICIVVLYMVVGSDSVSLPALCGYCFAPLTTNAAAMSRLGPAK